MGRMDEMMRTHAVALIAPDGARQENVRCSLLPPDLVIPDIKVDVAMGFEVEHKLPNGRIELYEVRELQSHLEENLYILKVRKKEPGRPAAGGSVVYNVAGNNARINIGSTDSSINVAQVDIRVLFERMRATAGSIPESKTRTEVIDSITQMEATAGSHSFSTAYQRFIAVVADHLSVFGPFLPALSQLILQ